jgi:hypothetical protein
MELVTYIYFRVEGKSRMKLQKERELFIVMLAAVTGAAGRQSAGTTRPPHTKRGEYGHRFPPQVPCT